MTSSNGLVTDGMSIPENTSRDLGSMSPVMRTIGYSRRAAAEPFAQLGTAETRQAHIENEAIHGTGVRFEVFGRREHSHVVAQAAEKAGQRPSHVLVVVNDR